MVIRGEKIKRAFFILFVLILSMLLASQINWFWKMLYPLKYEEIIIASARRYQLDPSLVAAIVFVESKYIPTASSYRGARGLMQIMPNTGMWIAEQLAMKEFDLNMLFDTLINVSFGCWYLANLQQEFNDDLIVVLAAYNAGRGNVKKWLESNTWDGCQENIEHLPFPETRRYIQQVLAVDEKYREIYDL